MKTTREQTKGMEQTHNRISEQLCNNMENDNQYLAEDFLENMNSTPLGRLLGMIGSLPEIRQEKVQHAQEKIRRGDYEHTTALDAALDRVIEEIICD